MENNVRIKDKHYYQEELLNSLTHGLGVVLSIVGLISLMWLAVEAGDTKRIVGFSIFGASLVILYLTSTLYHSFHNEKVKRFFRIMDHAAIYILIAGSYTPITLIALEGWVGIALLVAVWTAAIIGVVFKLFFTGRWDRISTYLYLAMGWMAILAIDPLLDGMPSGGLWLIFTGGMFYTGGVVFYLWDKLKFNHAIWHLFVLGGSVSHFLAVLLYLA